jgi:hypothetical protein
MCGCRWPRGRWPSWCGRVRSVSISLHRRPTDGCSAPLPSAVAAVSVSTTTPLRNRNPSSPLRCLTSGPRLPSLLGCCASLRLRRCHGRITAVLGPAALDAVAARSDVVLPYHSSPRCSEALVLLPFPRPHCRISTSRAAHIRHVRHRSRSSCRYHFSFLACTSSPLLLVISPPASLSPSLAPAPSCVLSTVHSIVMPQGTEAASVGESVTGRHHRSALFLLRRRNGAHQSIACVAGLHFFSGADIVCTILRSLDALCVSALRARVTYLS